MCYVFVIFKFKSNSFENSQVLTFTPIMRKILIRISLNLSVSHMPIDQKLRSFQFQSLTKGTHIAVEASYLLLCPLNTRSILSLILFIEKLKFSSFHIFLSESIFDKFLKLVSVNYYSVFILSLLRRALIIISVQIINNRQNLKIRSSSELRQQLRQRIKLILNKCQF